MTPLGCRDQMLHIPPEITSVHLQLQEFTKFINKISNIYSTK
jgi:hypothetical protein